MASEKILAVVEKYKAGELSAEDAAEMLYDPAYINNDFNEAMTKVLWDFHTTYPDMLQHYAACVGGVVGGDKETSSRAIEDAYAEWDFKRKVEEACAALIQPLIDDPTMVWHPWGRDLQEDDDS